MKGPGSDPKHDSPVVVDDRVRRARKSQHEPSTSEVLEAASLIHDSDADAMTQPGTCRLDNLLIGHIQHRLSSGLGAAKASVPPGGRPREHLKQLFDEDADHWDASHALSSATGCEVEHHRLRASVAADGPEADALVQRIRWVVTLDAET